MSEEIPAFLSALGSRLGSQKAEITYEERDRLECFNTAEYWWCYYDREKNILYDQYCRICDKDASAYLKMKGLIDEQGKVLMNSDIIHA